MLYHTCHTGAARHAPHVAARASACPQDKLRHAQSVHASSNQLHKPTFVVGPTNPDVAIGDGTSPADAVGVPVAEYGVPPDPMLPVRARPEDRTSPPLTFKGVRMGGTATPGPVVGLFRLIPCPRGPAPAHSVSTDAMAIVQ